MRQRFFIMPACVAALAACGGQKAANTSAGPGNTAATIGPSGGVNMSAAAAPDGAWQTTPSGLKYRRVSGAGTGPKPTPSDVVTIHYVGTLTDGTEFDSSMKGGEPVTFPLPSLIPGWQEGVPLMSVGDVFEFIVPPELGSGPRGSGPIPPNAVLNFRIGLIAIEGR
jgi:FKBP-type peptidyl-prolyl cis-trans isomerase FkpA